MENYIEINYPDGLRVRMYPDKDVGFSFMSSQQEAAAFLDGGESVFYGSEHRGGGKKHLVVYSAIKYCLAHPNARSAVLMLDYDIDRWMTRAVDRLPLYIPRKRFREGYYTWGNGSALHFIPFSRASKLRGVDFDYMSVADVGRADHDTLTTVFRSKALKLIAGTIEPASFKMTDTPLAEHFSERNRCRQLLFSGIKPLRHVSNPLPSECKIDDKYKAILESLEKPTKDKNLRLDHLEWDTKVNK